MVGDVVGVVSVQRVPGDRQCHCQELERDGSLNGFGRPVARFADSELLLAFFVGDLGGRPPKGQRKQGRPPTKGARLPKLSQIATDPTTQWVKTTVRRYGKAEQVMVHAFRCLWYEAFGSPAGAGRDHPRQDGHRRDLQAAGRRRGG